MASVLPKVNTPVQLEIPGVCLACLLCMAVSLSLKAGVIATACLQPAQQASKIYIPYISDVDSNVQGSRHTSASCSKALSRTPSIAGALDDFATSGVATVAGVNVEAALADTGMHAGRRLQLKELVRALRGRTATGPILSKLVDVCMCALMKYVEYLDTSPADQTSAQLHHGRKPSKLRMLTKTQI